MVPEIVQFQKKIHTHPKEGHRKSLWGGGGCPKSQNFMNLNWNFLGGGGAKKKPSMGGEYGYFLELHIVLFTQ